MSSGGSHGGWRIAKKPPVPDEIAAVQAPRVSVGVAAADDVSYAIPNGFRESQMSNSMKSVIKQGDPAGVRAWMAEGSMLDGLGAGVGSFRPASVSSGYSLASHVRVSQQLDRMSLGSLYSF